jgi:hypothetical protein
MCLAEQPDFKGPCKAPFTYCVLLHIAAGLHILVTLPQNRLHFAVPYFLTRAPCVS